MESFGLWNRRSDDMSFSLLHDDDLYLFNEGTHLRLYEKLGAHRVEAEGVWGTYFAVWAPNARQVSVVGGIQRLGPQRESPRAARSLRHLGRIRSREWNRASLQVLDLVPARRLRNGQGRSAGVYRRSAAGHRVGRVRFGVLVERSEVDGEPLSAECAFGPHLDLRSPPWIVDVGARGQRETSVPIAAWLRGWWNTLGGWVSRTSSFCRSWSIHFMAPGAIRLSAYYAPTRRYGTPQDLMYLIDYLHQHEIGVILDWVPSHFVTDAHGLGFFDGTHLYEHDDPRQGIHPDWNSFIFNYGRSEVRSFLLSNAMFWLDKYHVDGLRVDAVASMLYLDYSRKEGEWIPNPHGGRENLEAIAFLRKLNEVVYQQHPDVVTVAEESTAWPKVSRPVYDGGLGFGYKWDMGWMHDTLSYLRRDPIHRKHHHSQITFRSVYAFSENFILPLSHDEVVHGKGSLLESMAGDDWQKFANLRLLFGYMYAQPGKKLLFMGDEFAQRREWNHDALLDWELLALPAHGGVQKWVEDLNRLYANDPAMHARDCSPEGFQWVDGSDAERSVLCFLRRGQQSGEEVLVVCNFTPVPRTNYRVGVLQSGFYEELLNSDAPFYGGSGYGNIGGCQSVPIPCHGFMWSLNLTLPPLTIMFLKRRE